MNAGSPSIDCVFRVVRLKQQLKKKKQAAKRKGISTEEVEGDSGAQPTPAQPEPEPAGSTIGTGLAGGDAEKTGAEGGVEGRTEDVPSVPSVDMEMPDVSEGVEMEVAVGDVDMMVDPVTSITKIDDEMVVSVGGDDLPVPPAAPTNGNLSSVVGPRHNKSVSFVMAGADIKTLVGGASGSGRGPGGNVVPPLPPGTLRAAASRDVDKDSAAAGANEAFLRRNFNLGGNSEQVQH